MLTIVVIINVSISLLFLYIAWQLKKWGRKLGSVADSVTAAERSTYKLLHNAPKSIYKGQVGVKGLRGRYQKLGKVYYQLEFQLQQIRQVLLLLNLAQKFLRPRFPRSTLLPSGQAKGKNQGNAITGKYTISAKGTRSARSPRPQYHHRNR
ncbi:MAG: hypothetical protein F6K14_22845 [Symploca sp. SIO2C1]|nr:hypothetical protein [Symploca sp. SIO2C1]